METLIDVETFLCGNLALLLANVLLSLAMNVVLEDLEACEENTDETVPAHIHENEIG